MARGIHMGGAVTARRAAGPRVASPRVLAVMALTAALAALGTTLYTLALNLHPVPRDVAHPAFWLILGAFTVSELTVLHIELGKNAYSVSLSEIPLTIGLFLVSPAALPACRVIGTALAKGAGQRQRPLKLAFNLAAVLVEICLAMLVFRALGGDLSSHLHSALVPALAASVTSNLSMTIMVTTVIRLASGEMRVRTVFGFLRSGGASSLVNGGVGLVAVAAISWDRLSAWLLAVIGAVLILGYRGYSSLRQRHQNLELLYEFTRRLGDMDAAGEHLLEDVLRRIREILRADIVELGLLVGGDDTTASCSRLAYDDPLTVATRTIGPDDWPWLRALAQGEAVLIPAGTRDQSLRGYLTARGLKDCILTPLHGDHGLRGVLLVADRQGEAVSFGHDDRLLLQTVAAHAAAAIANSRLLERLNHDSRHDALTGLANRAWFQQQLAAALERDPQARASVLLMDLDRFKEVNDTLGHHYGDLLLIEVARRLTLHARRGDLLARLGGDEFAVLMLGTSGEEALVAGERIQQSLATPMHLEGVAVEVAASLGIAVAPDHGGDAMALMQRADVAMYSAKRAYTGVQLYDDSLDEYSPRRLAIASGLRHALESEQLSLHFQPQAMAADGRVVAAEALVRWEHPVYGNIPPDDFIGIAEQTAQIRDLTRFVLRTAIAQCRRWADAGRPIAVSVNLSVRNLLEHDLPDVVATLLAEHGVPASRLTLEITESHLMADPERTLGIITALAHAGVRLSVDDFGTGYSSLAYLKRLPVRELKIDKSFIRDIADGADDIAIVTSIVNLAQSLNLDVVAEGVEDRTTWERLAELGCTLVQGYHLARPMRPEQFDEWLEAHFAALPRQRARAFA